MLIIRAHEYLFEFRRKGIQKGIKLFQNRQFAYAVDVTNDAVMHKIYRGWWINLICAGD